MNQLPSSFIRGVFIFLFVVHASWLFVHVTLVTRGEVNPWKLGGYGMYTVPSISATIEVNPLVSSSSDIVYDIATDRFKVAMGHFNWYCLPLRDVAFTRLLDDNQWLVGTDFSLTAQTYRFFAYPPRLERLVLQEATVTWLDSERFTLRYHNPVCAQSGERTSTYESS